MESNAFSSTKDESLEAFVDRVACLVRSWDQRPSWDEYFMATALLISSRSICERLRVGCVLVSGREPCNRIIAAGYNGFLPGAPHISQLRDAHEQATVHAEQNAIADASRRGAGVEGSVAYITHFPCINCAKILASAGVKTIKYHSEHDNDELIYKLLSHVDIVITKL